MLFGTSYEKKRREEMSKAIDRINDLVPAPLSETAPGGPAVQYPPRSKMEALTEAADYFARVTDIARALIAENKRLAAELQQRQQGASWLRFGSYQCPSAILCCASILLCLSSCLP